MSSKRILLLAVGNTLLSDDGFGPAALEYLISNYRWPSNVSFVQGGTGGLMLMAELLECDTVVILDTVLNGNPPGSFYFIEQQDLARTLRPRQSMHQTGIEDVLISCELAGHRPEAYVFGFEPFDYTTFCPKLTPQASGLVPDFCARAVAKLANLGICQPEAKK